MSCIFLGQEAKYKLLISPKVDEKVTYEVSMNVTGDDPFQVAGKIEYNVDKVERDGSKTLTSTQKGMILRFGGGQEIRDDSPRTTQRKFGMSGEMQRSSDMDADSELRMSRLFWPNLPTIEFPVGSAWKMTELDRGKEGRVIAYKFSSVETQGEFQVAVIQYSLKEGAKNGMSATGEFRINLKDGWLESSHSKVENFEGEPGQKADVKYTRIH
ncbi:MAG: hypothetical protein KDC26_06945 [Armatimonadetes bacterium]|nr:hypothetical protein [Armatimonadota bacterium]